MSYDQFSWMVDDDVFWRCQEHDRVKQKLACWWLHSWLHEEFKDVPYRIINGPAVAVLDPHQQPSQQSIKAAQSTKWTHGRDGVAAPKAPKRWKTLTLHGLKDEPEISAPEQVSNTLSDIHQHLCLKGISMPFGWDELSIVWDQSLANGLPSDRLVSFTPKEDWEGLVATSGAWEGAGEPAAAASSPFRSPQFRLPIRGRLLREGGGFRLGKRAFSALATLRIYYLPTLKINTAFGDPFESDFGRKLIKEKTANVVPLNPSFEALWDEIFAAHR